MQLLEPTPTEPCPDCDGRGERVACIDDICHARGRCIHDGNEPCATCDGAGELRVATDGEGDDDEWSPSCWDCEREFSRRNLQPTEVMDHHEEGLGYDMVTVPMCHDCRLQRFGYDCPDCGRLWDDQQKAALCCNGPGPDGDVIATDGGLAVSDIRERDSPEQLDVEAIRSELSEIQEVWHGDADPSVGVDLADALDERGGALWRELEDRLDAEYPDCPNCGEHHDWGQEAGEPLLCYNCEHYPDEDVRQEIQQEWIRLHTGENGGDA